jgi:predicted RNA binding protein YcfA (HicA-like mRNA interferase family)
MLSALERAGFVVVRSKGSHHFLEHRNDHTRRTVISMHRGDLPEGTVQDILKQTRLKRDALLMLL